jgi:hypothetical protein
MSVPHPNRLTPCTTARKKTVRVTLLAAAALVVVVRPGLAQRPGSPNIAVSTIAAGPTLQVSAVTGEGPDSPLYLTAQMVQNIRTVAPYENVVQTLAPLVGSPLTAAAYSPGFSESCALTNSNTMLECTLSPAPGSGWSNANPMTLRIRLQSTSGHVATALVSYGAGRSAFTDVRTSAGTGPSPSTGNGAAIYVVAQLVRTITNQPPLENDALTLASFALTPAGSSLPFGSACVMTNGDTMLECTLTPSPGPNWSVGGPLTFRLRLTATDGSAATTTVQFRVG